MKEIIIYTDGSSLGNPGPGGWSAVLIYGSRRKEISGGFRKTTNNRMEILAAIKALQALNTEKRWKVKLHSDSKLLSDSINKGWAERWRQNGWKRNKKDKALNADLWAIILEEIKKHDVEFIWVAGHAGITENEVCDQLCKAAAEGQDLPPDIEYENSLELN